MANFTEQAITEALITLLNDRPLDKITVSDIASECGINRNTFYYHYHDVYELVEDLFKTETERVIGNLSDDDSIVEAFTRAISFVLENKQAITHVYQSVSSDNVNQFLIDAASACLRPYVEEQASDLASESGATVPTEAIDRVTYLYACMLQGIVVNMLRTDSFEDAADVVGDAVRALEGSIKGALANLASA
ncbi:MAG: TetR/AcrR family transcriptional regulator [Eggerthellaceae bacterium]|jgi:AcrR family transcriptional regulator